MLATRRDFILTGPSGRADSPGVATRAAPDVDDHDRRVAQDFLDSIVRLQSRLDSLPEGSPDVAAVEHGIDALQARLVELTDTGVAGLLASDQRAADTIGGLVQRVSDTLVESLSTMEDLEVEKRGEEPASPRFLELAHELDDLAAHVRGQTQFQESLAEIASGATVRSRQLEPRDRPA